jgi:cadmium resistance protein CadD (predicted permease)
MLSTLGRAIVAFAATNIDDIFVLTIFFAQKHLKTWHVVLGQYLGISALIAISLVGFFARLIIPATWIGWLGLAPIAIGIKKLIDWKRGKETDQTVSGAGSVLSVSAITIANGGDNTAVYIPLFANSDGKALTLTLITFYLMIAVWCVVGYYIGSHPVATRLMDRYGHILVPFVLIALGIFILRG